MAGFSQLLFEGVEAPTKYAFLAANDGCNALLGGGLGSLTSFFSTLGFKLGFNAGARFFNGLAEGFFLLLLKFGFSGPVGFDELLDFLDRGKGNLCGFAGALRLALGLTRSCP